jgi:S-DNA-T family DNA segregation ATPase FtsK/SpoIIIE
MTAITDATAWVRERDNRRKALRRFRQDVIAVALGFRRLRDRSFTRWKLTLSAIAALVGAVMIWALLAAGPRAAMLAGPAVLIVLYAATAPLRWRVHAVWRRQCIAADVAKVEIHVARIRTADFRAGSFGQRLLHGEKWQTVPSKEIVRTPKIKVSRSDLGWAGTVEMPAGMTVDLVAKRADRLAAGVWHAVHVDHNEDDPALGTVAIVRRDPFEEGRIAPPGGWLERTDFWEPVPFGIDQLGREVHLSAPYKSFLFGGNPGSGKSIAVNSVVAHAANDPTVPLYIVDGGESDFRPWRDCIRASGEGMYVGLDVAGAIQVLKRVERIIKDRQRFLAALPPENFRRRIERGMAPLTLFVLDEWASYLVQADALQRAEINRLMLYILANYRKAGVVPILATQNPRFDVVPTSIRDLTTTRWAGRVSTDGVSDIILGSGYAESGVSARRLTHAGVGWLVDDGHASKTKAYSVDDQTFIAVARSAAARRAEWRAEHPLDASPKGEGASVRSAVRSVGGVSRNGDEVVPVDGVVVSGEGLRKVRRNGSGAGGSGGS